MQSPSKAHQPPSEEIQISDEMAYNNYVSSLVAIFESHERLVLKRNVDADWFNEQAFTARKKGMSINIEVQTSLPSTTSEVPSRQIVNKKIQDLESMLEKIAYLEGSIKQKERQIQEQERQEAEFLFKLLIAIVLLVAAGLLIYWLRWWTILVVLVIGGIIGNLNEKS